MTNNDVVDVIQHTHTQTHTYANKQSKLVPIPTVMYTPKILLAKITIHTYTQTNMQCAAIDIKFQPKHINNTKYGYVETAKYEFNTQKL